MLRRATGVASRSSFRNYILYNWKGVSFSTGANNALKPKSRVWPFYFAVGSMLGGGTYYMLCGRGGEEGSSEASNRRNSSIPIWQKFTGFFTSFEEPAFEKLLPDPIVDPQNPRPYTLVIDLDKFLVCHIWDREQGRWRIAKRPGAELFLFYAAQLYEVVLFSALPQHEGDAIVKKLDPYGCISYSLYRFATKHKGGTYLKDISHLNRDLSKVIVIGHDEAGFAPHPENFIRVNPWIGSSKDTTLEDSIDFLETVAFSRLSDVRQIVRQFEGKTFPEYFEQTQENLFNANQNAQKNSLQGRIGEFLSFGRAKSSLSKVSTKSNTTNHSNGNGNGNGNGNDNDNNTDSSKDTSNTNSMKSYRDRKLERTELRRKEYERIRELMQKQLQAEMQKEKEYYAEHKMALWDLFAKGPPPPPPPPPKGEGGGGAVKGQQSS